MKRDSIKQAIRFCLVGILNTAVDYVVFYVFLAFLNADKSFISAVIIFSKSISCVRNAKLLKLTYSIVCFRVSRIKRLEK